MEPTAQELGYILIVASVITWFLFGISCAVVAGSRGSSALQWFGVGILLGPFGLLAAVITTGKKCPRCNSLINEKATECTNCGANFLTPEHRARMEEKMRQHWAGQREPDDDMKQWAEKKGLGPPPGLYEELPPVSETDEFLDGPEAR